MALPTRPSARRRALAIIAAAATTASGAALLGPGTSSASSHREAPYIANDPAVDNTDTYAFVSPDNAANVTLIANWSPFSEPAGGPNFFPWDTDAAYDINVDNDGDAKPDLVYRWIFSDVDKRGAGAGTFLYANGPVDTLDDPNLLFRQTYDLQVIQEGGPTVTLIDDGKVAPSNVGVATIPDYVKLRNEAILPVTGGGKSYVGQADDPFALDLRIFDLLYGGNLSEVGYDTLSGFNVNTVALELPKTALVAAGNATANPVIGVWSTTSRKKTRVFASDNATPTTTMTDSSDATTDTGPYVQVSRLGNPLVNEAVVPANLKDYFNRSTPDKDIQFVGKVQDPEVPQLIEGIYKIPNPNKLAGQTNDDKRNDLVGAFLTGFSKKNFASGPSAGVVDADLNSLNMNAVSPNAVPAEYLRLNVNVPPTAKENRLGVIGGDLAGFPNGRRLNDDVVDIALQVLEGVLLRPAGDLKTAVAGLGDAVSVNDRPFLKTFPFIADPHTGSDPRKGQTPVSFVQNFTSQNGTVTANATRISPAAKGGFAQLYRINADGSATGLGSSAISADGTATVTKTFRVAPGTRLTLNWRVFPARGSAAQENRGVPTTITVR
ncbi:MAG: hypothetical protein JWN08_1575 [Frankiales bacterium]|jgi:hypothetical protein|nr:hypothetical protein [Frankiales bacterium]